MRAAIWALVLSGCVDPAVVLFDGLEQTQVAEYVGHTGRARLETGPWVITNGVPGHATSGFLSYGPEMSRVCARSMFGPCEMVTCQLLEPIGPYPRASEVVVSSPSSYFRLLPPFDGPDGGTLFALTTSGEPMWSTGESVLFVASDVDGGVPAWSSSVVGPDPITVLEPLALADGGFEATRGSPLVVRWTGGRHEVIAQVGDAQCRAPASDGELTIPPEVFARVGEWTNFRVDSVNQGAADAGEWNVHLDLRWRGEFASGALVEGRIYPR
ncbi:MAG: hypothetical protein QM767_15820 [Anaeromyxobacter sp.]